MSVSVPTIDFGAFEGRDPEAHARVVRQVADACERVGFFFASNHGIEERVLSDALRHARGFFEQPLEAKMRVADLKKGYIPVGGCDNAVRPSSMHEKFSCGPVDVDENDEYYVGADARAALYFGERNRWPNTPSGFRDAYESYYRAVVGFVDKLHRAFAEALGAPPTFFSRSSRKHVSNLVALRYPPVEDFEASKSPLERVRPHTDPTDVTVLLFEDGPRGLQVMPEGGASANEWIDVPDDFYAADRDDDDDDEQEERMKKKKKTCSSTSATRRSSGPTTFGEARGTGSSCATSRRRDATAFRWCSSTRRTTTRAWTRRRSPRRRRLFRTNRARSSRRLGRRDTRRSSTRSERTSRSSNETSAVCATDRCWTRGANARD